MNSNIEAANHVRDQRVIAKTKKGYLSKLNVLKIYLTQNGYGDQYISAEGDLLIHEATIEDQREILSAFFGWLATNTDLPRQRRRVESLNLNRTADIAEGDEDTEPTRVVSFSSNERTIAVSSMVQYKSAIVWYYQERNVIMDKSVDMFLRETMKGYKKIVAQKKVRGVMDVEEGKSKLSFIAYDFCSCFDL